MAYPKAGLWSLWQAYGWTPEGRCFVGHTNFIRIHPEIFHKLTLTRAPRKVINDTFYRKTINSGTKLVHWDISCRGKPFTTLWEKDIQKYTRGQWWPTQTCASRMETVCEPWRHRSSYSQQKGPQDRQDETDLHFMANIWFWVATLEFVLYIYRHCSFVIELKKKY